MQPKAATVYVVDDDKTMRDSLRFLVQSVGLPVETFETGEAFLETYDADRPGCVVLDLRMPGMSGLAVQSQLAQLPVSPPVILITAHGDVPMTVQAMKAGAVDVLQKPYRDQALLECIQQALAKDSQRRQHRVQQQEIRDRLASLTTREREVLNLVLQGKPNKVIALHLHLSEKTVEVHRSHVMEKMKADSLAELVRNVTLVELAPAP